MNKVFKWIGKQFEQMLIFFQMDRQTNRMDANFF